MATPLKKSMHSRYDLEFVNASSCVALLLRGAIFLALMFGRGGMPAVAQEGNTQDTIDDAYSSLWKHAWAIRQDASADRIRRPEGVPADVAPASVANWLTAISSQCDETRSLRQRERCGRLQLVAADAPLIRARLNQHATSTGDPHSRNVKSAATRVIEYLNGHDGGLTSYKDNYFTLRPDPTEAKFQVSFKYKLFVDTRDPVTGTGTAGNWWRDSLLSNSYFSYTQKSFWDLDSPSSPFRDINFNPQLFLYYPKNNEEEGITGYWIGAEHESNGRDGFESRSWDRLFMKWEFSYGPIIVTPKLWYVLNKADENSDIEDFAGFGELSARYELPNGTRLSMTGRRGQVKGGAELVYSFRWRALIPANSAFGRFDPWIHVRYWTGYGEGLLDYDVKSSNFRVGLALALTPVFPERR